MFYDITSSPHENEGNDNRYEDIMIGERNHTTMKISGPGEERELSDTFKDSNGEVIVQNKIAI